MAERHGKVPPGKHLAVSSLGYREWKIELVDAPEGTSRELSAVRVPERVARYHPAVAAFRDDSRRHESQAPCSGARCSSCRLWSPRRNDGATRQPV